MYDPQSAFTQYLCERCHVHTELFYCKSTDEYLCENCIMALANAAREREDTSDA